MPFLVSFETVISLKSDFATSSILPASSFKFVSTSRSSDGLIFGSSEKLVGKNIAKLQQER